MKLKVIAIFVLCLNVSGCEYVEGILHPDNGDDEAKIDKDFKSDALQLGLSETTVTRLCTATDKISVNCISVLNSETNQKEVRVEYTFNDITLKNDYAKSTNGSRIIFHLPVDGATASIEFENGRTYLFNEGYEYNHVDPMDFATDSTTANLANSAEESIAKLASSSVIVYVSDSELSRKSTASIRNRDYSLTEAQDLINAAGTIMFPVLIVNVTGNGITEPTDVSFAAYTAGYTAILSNYSSAISTAIEQSWF
ncbi:hypothetical protein [Shewanella sp. KX20019]|uniref:hypothetical protein n=1 Tax=Shewanella sp. KX20019 TaxID=2803864 RepID=UPI001F3602AA|nr:hypothetical protein [Shewanella sp. KX20019]